MHHQLGFLIFSRYVSKHSLTAHITDLFWETETRVSLLSTGNYKSPRGKRNGEAWSSSLHCLWNWALPSVVEAWLGLGSATPWSTEKHQSPGSFQENAIITLKCLCSQQTNLLLLTVRAFLIVPDMGLLFIIDDRQLLFSPLTLRLMIPPFLCFWLQFPCSPVVFFFRDLLMKCYKMAQRWWWEVTSEYCGNSESLRKVAGAGELCGSTALSVHTWASQARLTGIQFTKFYQFSQRHLTGCARREENNKVWLFNLWLSLQSIKSWLWYTPSKEETRKSEDQSQSFVFLL